jgi:hypothetical protein
MGEFASVSKRQFGNLPEDRERSPEQYHHRQAFSVIVGE